MSVESLHMRLGGSGVRALALGSLATLVLTSCALFKPQRVEVVSQVSETIPGRPITSSPAPGAPAAGPKTVFIPGQGGSGGTPNYASAPGVTKDTIALGTIQPMDGPAAQVGKPLYRTTQAYVSALNARGGINGRKVVLYLQTACLNCNQENLLAAKALVEQKHVFAIVNTYMNTYAFDAAIKYLNDRHVPLVEGWSGIGDTAMSWGAQQTPWSVYYTIRNDTALGLWADWMQLVLDKWKQAGKLPVPAHPYWVATVGLNVSQDNKRADEFRKVWEARGAGYKVVTQQRVDAEEETVTRMDSFVAAMKDAQANGVFSSSNITMLFGMQAGQRQSWKVPWVTKSAWGRALTDNCGSACDGGYTDNNGWGWPGNLTPQMQQYMSTMRAFYPDGARYADAQTLGGWIGMMAFEYAASQLGADLTRQGVMNTLGNLKNCDTGIGSVINTDPTDHLGMRQMYMLQVCKNHFYNVSSLLTPGIKPRRVDPAGDTCGWGY